VLEAFGSHVAQSVDISAASAELRHFAKHESSFEHEIESFKPCDPRIYRDPAITLGKALREQVGERAEWLYNIDRSVRDLLTQFGTILGTRENIKLQN